MNQRDLRHGVRLAICLSLLFESLLFVGVAHAQWSVQWQNSLEINAAGFSPGQLSGITFLGNDEAGESKFLAVSDTNGEVFQIHGAFDDATGVNTAVVTDQWTIEDTSLDAEGLAFHPNAPTSVFISYEDDVSVPVLTPGVREYDMANGQRLQSVSLPSVWSTGGNVVNNRGFESLTRSVGGKVMWTANEEALTIDGNLATSSSGTTVRLQKMIVDGSTVTSTSQFAYEVDPVHGPSPDRSGLVELVALPDGNLLALERSAAVTVPLFENRIYQIDFTAATDISDPAFDGGLTGANYTAVGKTLLWSGAVDGGFGANMEALALRSSSVAGSWSLLGVVDDGDGVSTNLAVAFALSPPAAYGDFDLDGDFDCMDIDALIAEIIAGTNSVAFDLSGDGAVDGDDQTAWLSAAALANDLPGPHLLGDANLDGIVDGLDFIAWNGNKFTPNPSWCAGNFNHDGIVDGLDFILWNGNKFTSSGARTLIVPEPTALVLAVVCLLGACGRLRSSRPGLTAC